MRVYAYDSNRPPVKIEKHGKYWCIYPLQEIKKTKVIFADIYKPSETWYKFRWAESPKESYTYKPFEDGDVLEKPTKAMVEHVETWNNHLTRWDISDYGYHDALKAGYKRLG